MKVTFLILSLVSLANVLKLLQIACSVKNVYAAILHMQHSQDLYIILKGNEY